MACRDRRKAVAAGKGMKHGECSEKSTVPAGPPEWTSLTLDDIVYIILCRIGWISTNFYRERRVK
jgi:hypothetical protein